MAFGLYALALFTATHWPGLAIESDIRRPDLGIHAVVLALWTVLLVAAAPFGPALSVRNTLACAGVAGVYAALDEALQAIPALNRHAAWDDLVANLLGVALGTLGSLGAAALARRRNPSG